MVWKVWWSSTFNPAVTGTIKVFRNVGTRKFAMLGSEWNRPCAWQTPLSRDALSCRTKRMVITEKRSSMKQFLSVFYRILLYILIIILARHVKKSEEIREKQKQMRLFLIEQEGYLQMTRVFHSDIFLDAGKLLFRITPLMKLVDTLPVEVMQVRVQKFQEDVNLFKKEHGLDSFYRSL
jgi:hypothetical protein